MMWVAVGTFAILVLRTISGQIINPLTQQISILAENVRSLKEALEEIRADMTTMRERMANNEATTKALHNRVDHIEERLNKE